MRRRLRITGRFYLLLAAVLLLGFGLSFGMARLRIRQIQLRVDRLLHQRADAEARLQALEEAVAFAQTDAYVEQIARSELNLIYPGEIRYIAAAQ